MSATRRTLLAGLLLLAAIPAASAGQRVLGVDQTGKALDAASLPGWKLVYFGYTHCPDVCPLGLQTMADALNGLGALGEKLTPVFVTVDPERDTPSVLADYVNFFHPRLVGVTPSEDELKAMAAAWRIKYAKVEIGEGRPYLMDHTASILLVDPAGEVAGRLSHNLSSERVVEKIRSVLEARP